MKKNLLKLKIENIAQNLFNNNQNYNNDLKEETNINQLSSDESTIKDSLSEFEELSKSIHRLNHIKNQRNNRNKNNLYFKNSNHASIQSEKHQSSLCTKMTSLTENNSINGTLEFNMNSEQNKKYNIKNKSNENIENKTYKEAIDKNEIAKINKFNIYKINNLKNIYIALLEIFNSSKILEKDTQEYFKEIADEVKLISYKYINFVFSEDMELLINMFNDILEVHKFLIIEIYFFISIIYLFDEKTLSNNYLLISYKSSLFYSVLNFENIMIMLNNPLPSNKDKILINIKSINKIILPILKLININIPSNSQIKEFISPLDSNKNKRNNKMGIYKLISLLKKNDNLKKELNNLINLEQKIKSKKIIKLDLEEQEKEIIPMLPLMDCDKHKFSLAVELDETLVHYCEEGDNYFAKVRFGSENFLKNLSNFFEIIIISNSNQEYSNIIIDNLNKNGKCYVKHRIYTEDFNENQDLSKINRDIDKILFVCHDYDFINAPRENIILLREFLGEEEDREIVKLYHELKMFINSYNKVKDDNFDIRNIVPEIMKGINTNYDNEENLDDDE